jgi:hypothetical protein
MEPPAPVTMTTWSVSSSCSASSSSSTGSRPSRSSGATGRNRLRLTWPPTISYTPGTISGASRPLDRSTRSRIVAPVAAAMVMTTSSTRTRRPGVEVVAGADHVEADDAAADLVGVVVDEPDRTMPRSGRLCSSFATITPARPAPTSSTRRTSPRAVCRRDSRRSVCTRRAPVPAQQQARQHDVAGDDAVGQQVGDGRCSATSVDPRRRASAQRAAAAAPAAASAPPARGVPSAPCRRSGAGTLPPTRPSPPRRPPGRATTPVSVSHGSRPHPTPRVAPFG